MSELLWYPCLAIAYLLIVYLYHLIQEWRGLAVAAYRLADHAVAQLNAGTCDCYQVIENYCRRLPPRFLYVSVAARRGEPVRMYRGCGVTPLFDADAGITPGLMCRKVR